MAREILGDRRKEGGVRGCHQVITFLSLGPPRLKCYGHATDAALGEFEKAMAESPALDSRIWFDLAAVVVPGIFTSMQQQLPLSEAEWQQLCLQRIPAEQDRADPRSPQ